MSYGSRDFYDDELSWRGSARSLSRSFSSEDTSSPVRRRSSSGRRKQVDIVSDESLTEIGEAIHGVLTRSFEDDDEMSLGYPYTRPTNKKILLDIDVMPKKTKNGRYSYRQDSRQPPEISVRAREYSESEERLPSMAQQGRREKFSTFSPRSKRSSSYNKNRRRNKNHEESEAYFPEESIKKYPYKTDHRLISRSSSGATDEFSGSFPRKKTFSFSDKSQETDDETNNTSEKRVKIDAPDNPENGAHLERSMSEGSATTTESQQKSARSRSVSPSRRVKKFAKEAKRGAGICGDVLGSVENSVMGCAKSVGENAGCGEDCAKVACHPVTCAAIAALWFIA